MRNFELKPVPPPGRQDDSRPELSVVAPAFNECQNLEPLLESVRSALEDKISWELILVDDGSSDGSLETLAHLQRQEARLRFVVQGKNHGQTSALAAGFRAARAPLIATLDADLQNAPADIPKMLAVLAENDSVCGYREKRNDNLLRRTSSVVANFIRNTLTGDHVRDTGCGLKLFRTEAIRAIPLFEGMHRFLPTLLRWHGFKVIEIPVSHHERTRGVSKYGVRNRALRALRDLIAVCWMRKRLIRPLPGAQEPARELAAQSQPTQSPARATERPEPASPKR